MADADVTEDALLGGRIRIRQPAKGYRANVDTLLLAAALPAASIGGGRIIEPGCGVGTALLALAAGAAHEREAEFIGIERDPQSARLARENVELNGQAHRARILEGDALDPHADYGLADIVLFNPPYDAAGEGRPPSPGKTHAFIAERPVGDWIRVWSNRMRAQAHLTLIHRAHRLKEVLDALEGRLGGVCVYPVRPHAAAPARRILVRAHKGSRAPLQMHRGLDLHPADGNEKYTPEADAILRGDTSIVLS